MKLKKFLSLALVCMVVPTMTACSGKDSSTDKSKNQGAGDKVYTIKLGHVEAEDRSTHRAALEFEKFVEEKSGGKVQVEIHPNAVLGGDVQLTESTALGTIQMSLPATSVLTMYSKDFGVLDMPFLFDSIEASFNAMDGDLGKKLITKLDGVGVNCLGYNFNGPRCMTNSKRPINEPKDLQGLKMRVMESPVFITLFETLGANATPMSFSELFTGLQQKTVDAQENPPSLIYACKFQEVQKYLSLTNHVNNFLAVLINENFYNSLPSEYQAILDEGVQTYLVEGQRAMELEDNDKYIEKLKEAGMEVNEIAPENQAKFQEVLKVMYDKYEKELGPELFKLARKYN